MNDELRNALTLAEAGLKVTPLRIETKRPAVKGWQEKATGDPATLRRWFGSGRYAVGLPTGAINGVSVIDVDVKNGDGFAAARGAGLDLSAGVRVDTPSGGAHFGYAHREGVRNDPPRGPDGERIPHIDVRGDGGLVRVYDAAAIADGVAVGLAPWPLSVPLRKPPSAARFRPDLPWPVFENALRRASEAVWDDRDFWLKAGMACSFYGDDGRALWDELSAVSGKFDPDAQDKTWAGFRTC